MDKVSIIFMQLEKNACFLEFEPTSFNQQIQQNFMHVKSMQNSTKKT